MDDGAPATTHDPKAARYDVVIAGGGFAGGTLALALASLGPRYIRVALVDAAALDPGANANTEAHSKSFARADARGLALSAASENLLNAVGVWPALAARAQAIESIEITDSSLSANVRPQFLGFDDEITPGETRAHLVEAGNLLQAIASAVTAESKIDCFAPDCVIDCATDGFGAEVRLESGTVLRAPLVVAADGKRSRLRERAGIKCVGWSYPQVGIVATLAHERPHNGHAVQHFLPAGPFAILPLAGNRSSIVWTEEKASAEQLLAGNGAGFLSELTRRFGHRLGELTLESEPQSFPLSFQMARSFVGDRLALIGDAAHVVHPLAGQGLNIGLRDVAALVETVVDAARLGLDIGAPTILERYERWRRFDSALSGVGMDGLNRLFSNDNAPLRAIRDLGLGIVDRAPGLKRFLVREAAGATGDVPRLLKGEAL